jgi:hypothetical protein
VIWQKQITRVVAGAWSCNSGSASAVPPGYRPTGVKVVGEDEGALVVRVHIPGDAGIAGAQEAFRIVGWTHGAIRLVLLALPGTFGAMG